MRCPSCFHELFEDSSSCPACGSVPPDSIAATMTGASAPLAKPESKPVPSSSGFLPGVSRRSSWSSQTYKMLRDQVDALCARLTQRYDRHLVCRSGCSSCCRHHLSVFAVEAAVLRRAIIQLPETMRMQLRAQVMVALEKRSADEPESCPLLMHDCCSVYADRPVICRTQGLPLLLVAEDGSLEVDYCPLNFTVPGAIAELEEEFLVPLEMLNQELVLANLEYCRAAGLDASGARTRVGDLVAEPMAENQE